MPLSYKDKNGSWKTSAQERSNRAVRRNNNRTQATSATRSPIRDASDTSIDMDQSANDTVLASSTRLDSPQADPQRSPAQSGHRHEPHDHHAQHAALMARAREDQQHMARMREELLELQNTLADERRESLRIQRDNTQQINDLMAAFGHLTTQFNHTLTDQNTHHWTPYGRDDDTRRAEREREKEDDKKERKEQAFHLAEYKAIDIYNGHNSNRLEEWIADVEEAARNLNMPALTIAKSKAKGLVREIIKDSRGEPWGTVAEKLRRKISHASIYTHTSRLWEMKQKGDESLATYISRFKKAKALVTLTDEPSLINIFLSGLRNTTMVSRIYEKKPTTIQEAINHSEDLEEAHRFGQTKNVTINMVNDSPGDDHPCNNCTGKHKHFHKWFECPDITCNKCGQMGHIGRYCTEDAHIPSSGRHSHRHRSNSRGRDWPRDNSRDRHHRRDDYDDRRTRQHRDSGASRRFRSHSRDRRDNRRSSRSRSYGRNDRNRYQDDSRSNRRHQQRPPTPYRSRHGSDSDSSDEEDSTPRKGRNRSPDERRSRSPSSSSVRAVSTSTDSHHLN